MAYFHVVQRGRSLVRLDVSYPVKQRPICDIGEHRLERLDHALGWYACNRCYSTGEVLR